MTAEVISIVNGATTDDEEWRVIEDRGDVRYEASNLGNIRSIKTLRGSARPRGNYLYVTISTPDGEKRKRFIHSLVAEAFLGQKPVGAEVRHLDGNPRNNRADNLAYGTPKENAADRASHGTQHRGERTGGAKLTEGQVIDIRHRIEAGEPHAAIAKDHNVSLPTLSDIKQGRTWGWLEDSESEVA